MNDGRPMAPKLMYEFPRAAMNLELKRGRNFLGHFLTKLYGETEWTRASVHDWIAEWKRDNPMGSSYNTQTILAIFSPRVNWMFRHIRKVGMT
jgi:hypothetical protein